MIHHVGMHSVWVPYEEHGSCTDSVGSFYSPCSCLLSLKKQKICLLLKKNHSQVLYKTSMISFVLAPCFSSVCVFGVACDLIVAVRLSFVLGPLWDHGWMGA